MLAAVAAVLTGVSAAAPEGPAMISVVKARSQLPAGSVVSTADLLLDRVAASDVPDGVLTDPVALVGKTLAAPVAENQMMTPLAATDARTSVPRGHVIAPLRLADATLAGLLRPGDLIDVIAADPQAGQATVVAAGARAPEVGAGSGPEGALVLIDVDAHTASVVAQAAAAATLSIIWR